MNAVDTNIVERLYTEDFTAYPLIDSLQVINPFSQRV